MKKRLLLLSLFTTITLGSCSKFNLSDLLFSTDSSTFSETENEESKKGSFQTNTDGENLEDEKAPKADHRATIIFYVDDEEVKTTCGKGILPVFPSPIGPSRQPTNTIKYVFDHWEPELVPVEDPSVTYTYTAVFREEVRKYHISFDIEGEITVIDFEYGEMPSFGSTPTYESAEYDYTFSKWEPELTEVTKETTYTAVFTKTKRKYKITFDVEGKETEDDFAYGTLPSYPGTPTKESTDEFEYTFDGWEPELTSVTGPQKYTAKFKATKRKYNITFDVDGNETILSFEYGEMPSFGDSVPTRPATADSTYTFKGWQPEITPVVGPQRYVALFNSSTSTYMVTFKAGDKILQSSEWKYGTTPKYNGDAIYTSDYYRQNENGEWENYKGYKINDKCRYIFNGWDKEITPVTDDIVYNAVLLENEVFYYAWRCYYLSDLYYNLYYTRTIEDGDRVMLYWYYPAYDSIGEVMWADGRIDGIFMQVTHGLDIYQFYRSDCEDIYVV